MQQNQEMLEKGSYGSLILKLSIPTIIIMLVMIIYNMADTFFIGQTGDPNKIAAISLCGPLFSVLSGLGTLFGSGGCTAISLALGKNERGRIKAVTSVCCYGALLIGIIFFVLVYFFTPIICTMLGADADTIDYTVKYLRVIALGAPLILFNNVFANIIRADGAAAQSMISNLLGTFVNIGLDALFILGFQWGVTGAAAATVIGNTVSCLYLFYYITRKQPAFSLNPGDVCLKSEILTPVLTLGLPMACSTLLMSFSGMLANRLMTGYGNTALAATGVSGKIGMLLTMLSMGICMGFQPAISYNYSKGNRARMVQIIRNTAIFTVAVGSALTVICLVFRNSIIAAFIDNEEVIKYGQVMVIASLLASPIYGLYQLCQTFLQSTGKAAYATFVSVLDKGLVYIPVLYLLEHFFGAYGIAFTSFVTLIFSLTVGILCSIRWNQSLEICVNS